jgi:hypothetical protein
MSRWPVCERLKRRLLYDQVVDRFNIRSCIFILGKQPQGPVKIGLIKAGSAHMY